MHAAASLGNHLALDSDTTKLAQFIGIEIAPRMQDAAVVPHHQITSRPTMFIGESGLFLMIE